MATYGQLCAKIADDLARPGYADQIRAAVQAAIAFYEAEPFAWSEKILTLPGAADSDTIALVTVTQTLPVRKVRSVRLLSPQLWSLRPAHTDWIEARQDGSIKGDPTHYAWAGFDTLRLYPIPHRDYVLRLLADCDQPPLTADGDANFWTTEGFELIRAHAKADLLANLIRGGAGREEATTCLAQAALHLSRLKGKLVARLPHVLRGDAF